MVPVHRIEEALVILQAREEAALQIVGKMKGIAPAVTVDLLLGEF